MELLTCQLDWHEIPEHGVKVAELTYGQYLIWDSESERYAVEAGAAPSWAAYYYRYGREADR